MKDRCSLLLELVQAELDKADQENANGMLDLNSLQIEVPDVPEVEDAFKVNETSNIMMNAAKNEIAAPQAAKPIGCNNTPPSIQSFVENESTREKLEDVAIILAFYGTDISRIEATTRALHYLLESTKMPNEWVFVEAQASKNDACFGWLKRYGIKYIFIKTLKQSNGIFLKTPLWNIGATSCNASKLCFIDSDVMFKNQDWLEEVYKKFDDVDVMSIGGLCAREESADNPHNSVGKLHELDKSMNGTPHAGFTIGMTRAAFNMIHGFDAGIILVDIWNWLRIVGQDSIKELSKWIPFDIPKHEKHGYPLRLGSTDLTCIHLQHGKYDSNKYFYLTNILKGHANCLEDIIDYDKSDFLKLPTWKEGSSVAKIVLNCILNKYDGVDGSLAYFNEARREFGQISVESPLVICTYLAPAFATSKQTIDDIYSKLQENCQDDFTFVVFTDLIKQDEVEYDIIPLSKFDDDAPWMQCFRKDVKFPTNTNIFFMRPTIKLDEKIEFACCLNGEMARSLDGLCWYFKSNLSLKKAEEAKLSKYMNSHR